MRSIPPSPSRDSITARVLMPPVSITGTPPAAVRARRANAAKYASLTPLPSSAPSPKRGRGLIRAAGDLDQVDALLDEQAHDLFGVVLGEPAVPEVRGVQLHAD